MSLDIFLMYFLHELALVPTFIMIGVWGRGQDKDFAAYKITLYLSLGALLTLAGVIMLYLQFGTFSLLSMMDHGTQFAGTEEGVFSATNKMLFLPCSCLASEFWSGSGRSTPGRHWGIAQRQRQRR